MTTPKQPQRQPEEHMAAVSAALRLIGEGHRVYFEILSPAGSRQRLWGQLAGVMDVYCYINVRNMPARESYHYAIMQPDTISGTRPKEWPEDDLDEQEDEAES